MTYRNHLSPPVFPYAWASDWGEDRYGLWQAFTYKGVRHAFRWIQPGKFDMGSPEDDSGRHDDEDPHHVKITQGFWLAETTVTQSLWQTIMGDNPSDFIGSNRPVENISWNDTQTFLAKLNQVHSDLSVRLPWEAEWEYACRAGTQTPFNFDGEVNLQRVNYSGIFDGGGWEENAKKETVDVRSYPCNDWGLYEMHGNVWEWCEDIWRDHLGKDAVSDPKGITRGDKEGVVRVVRGGSWYDDGRGVHSAIRDHGSPVARNDLVGCRLALLQPAAQEGKK